MSGRDTYNSTVKSAAVTKTATLNNNETAKQTTIDAAKSVVGYTIQTGNNASLIAATTAAVNAKRDADFAAEQAKQAAIAVARDTLRTNNDFGPA